MCRDLACVVIMSKVKSKVFSIISNIAIRPVLLIYEQYLFDCCSKRMRVPDRILVDDHRNGFDDRATSKKETTAMASPDFHRMMMVPDRILVSLLTRKSKDDEAIWSSCRSLNGDETTTPPNSKGPSFWIELYILTKWQGLYLILICLSLDLVVLYKRRDFNILVQHSL